MTAFYNEPDPYAAQWLRNMISAGHIAPGIVDERKIQDIEPYELNGFTQCHFFAGIGVWSLALRRAGWKDEWPIWSGSCPCQPFSAAGNRKGISDDRHLWPHWDPLIAERRPAVIVGEQVASKDGLGWLDIVSAGLEASHYAFGASDLCAAGFGQAHIRQRLYFVGLADRDGQRQNGLDSLLRPEDAGRDAPAISEIAGCGTIVGLADDDDAGLERRAGMSECGNQCAPGASGMAGGMEYLPGDGREQRRAEPGERGTVIRCGVDGMGNTPNNNRRGRERSPETGTRTDAERRRRLTGSSAGNANTAIRDPGEIDQRWLDADWLLCRNPSGEPSWRPVEPGSFPLAHGVASRASKLRAIGNALDLETATAFCKVVREIVHGV